MVVQLWVRQRKKDDLDAGAEAGADKSTDTQTSMRSNANESVENVRLRKLARV